MYKKNKEFSDDTIIVENNKYTKDELEKLRKSDLSIGSGKAGLLENVKKNDK